MLLPDKATRMALGGYLPYLTGYWSSRRGPVEAGGTLMDNSGAVHSATLTATCPVEAGVGLVGNGTDAYAVVGTNVYKTDTYGCFMCWAKLNASIIGLATSLFSLCVPTKARMFAFAVIASSRKPYWQYYDHPTNIVYNSNKALDSDWNHLCLLHTGSVNKIYVNGIDYGISNIVGSGNRWCADMPADTYSTRIASMQWKTTTTNSYLLEGDMDEIMMLSDVAVDIANVRAVYECQRHLFGV